MFRQVKLSNLEKVLEELAEINKIDDTFINMDQGLWLYNRDEPLSEKLFERVRIKFPSEKFLTLYNINKTMVLVISKPVDAKDIEFQITGGFNGHITVRYIHWSIELPINFFAYEKLDKNSGVFLKYISALSRARENARYSFSILDQLYNSIDESDKLLGEVYED